MGGLGDLFVDGSSPCMMTAVHDHLSRHLRAPAVGHMQGGDRFEAMTTLLAALSVPLTPLNPAIADVGDKMTGWWSLGQARQPDGDSSRGHVSVDTVTVHGVARA